MKGTKGDEEVIPEDDPFTERMPGSWPTEAMQHLTDRFGYLKYSSLKYSI